MTNKSNGKQQSVCRQLTQVVLMGVISLYMIPQVNAQEGLSTEATATPAPVASPFKQCAAENNVTLPTPGSGQHLAKEDWKKIITCVKAKRAVAFKACVAENNITLPTPGSGQHLTPEQHKALKQCLAAKGFKKWHHHHGCNHHHHQHPQPHQPQQQEDSAS